MFDKISGKDVGITVSILSFILLLAGSVAGAAYFIAERIGSIETKISSVETNLVDTFTYRLDEVEGRLSTRIDNVSDRVYELDTRLVALETKVDMLATVRPWHDSTSVPPEGGSRSPASTDTEEETE